MMKFFGYKIAGSHEVQTLGAPNLTRFGETKVHNRDTVRSRTTSAQGRDGKPNLPEAAVPALKALALSTPERPQLPVTVQRPIRAATPAPAHALQDDLPESDQLHSEAGLSPAILRRALPGRFVDMDKKAKELNDTDLFNLRTSLA